MHEGWRPTTWGAESDLKYGKALSGYRELGGSVEVFGTNGPIGRTTSAISFGPCPIVGRKGAYRGVHLAKGPFWVIDTAYWLEAGPQLDPIWAYYALLQVDINGMDSGSAIPSLTREHFRALPLLIPPLPAQRRIARVLGALDELIEVNILLQQHLLEMRSAVMSEVIDEVDNANATVGDVAVLSSERTDPNKATGETIYLGLEHFGEDGAGLQTFGFSDAVKSQKSTFRPGDILYGKLRPYFRKVARPDFGGVCSTEIWVIRPVQGVDPEFLEWIVSSQEFTNFAMLGSTGTHMPRASWDFITRMPIGLPEPQVISTAAAITSPMRLQYWALRAENEHLTRTRDELLPLLMSGRISVVEVAA